MTSSITHDVTIQVKSAYQPSSKNYLTSNIDSRFQCQVLIMINKNKLKNLNDGRHTRKPGTSKSKNELTKASPFLQAILSRKVRDNFSKNYNSVITVHVQNKKIQPQTLTQHQQSKPAPLHIK